MNIAAIKAYTSAAGVRPTLPARNKNAITDNYDIQAKNNYQSETSVKTPDDNIVSINIRSQEFQRFTSTGNIEKFAAVKGSLFDGKA